jgi:FKBP-type peptidyl-prolyl cis-trans isomerase
MGCRVRRLTLLAGLVLAGPLMPLARAAEASPVERASPEALNRAAGRQVAQDLQRLGLRLDPAALVEGARDASLGRSPAPGEALMRKVLGQLRDRTEAGVADPVPDGVVLSYGLGYVIGEDFVDEGIRLEPQGLLVGAGERLGAAPAAAKVDGLAPWLNGLKRRMAAAADVQPAPVYLDPVQAFFDDNAKRQDVQTLASGLQLRVLRSGNGPQPTAGDKVVLAYSGSLLNGTVFTVNQPSRRDQDATGYVVSGLFPGLREAVLQMNEGAILEVFVPTRLGPPLRRGSVMNGQALVYEVELLKIENPDGDEAAPAR